MPGCAAIGCSNSAKKGFLMKRFPKDPKRRKEWAIKMKRDKWKPTDSSCLCEAHFAPEMWENTRVDGTRKLKSNAVPTIFSFTTSVPQRRKPPVARVKHPSPPSVETCREEAGEASGTIVDLPEMECVELTGEGTTTVTTSTSSDTTDTDDQKVEQDKGDLDTKLAIYEKMYFQQRQKTAKYKRQLRNCKRQLKSLQTKMSVQWQSSLLNPLFTQDQIVFLQRRKQKKSTKFLKWSDATIIRALKVKFSCGNNGFEELIRQGYPLPSVRTLQRKLQNLKFDSGILDEVFEFLKIKVETFQKSDKDCALVLDEAAITPGNNFDLSLRKYFGEVTLPEHSGTATHVLVFMLAGLRSRWKQVICYYFSGDSVNGAVFKPIIMKIFQKAEDLQLDIVSITSDMGACNQALWRTLDVGAGRHSVTRCKIKHPIHEDRFVYIFADVPHLFKNIKSMLMNNKIIRIPEDIKEKHGLPSNEVLSSHIAELVQHQKNHCFQLAPKLTEDDLLPSHFKQMKVKTSTNVISHSVSSALKYLSDELKRPNYLTTAWFLDQIEKWFYIMTSRQPSCALSKLNCTVYGETIKFLKSFMDLFQRMEVGVKRLWKPAQTGITISTQSMLELHAVLLEEKQYEFVLTSRFSQDCLENLFSVLRSKQIVPTALQVKNNLKLISVSQYLKHSTSSSYEKDDRELLSGFLETIHQQKPKYDPVQLPPHVPEAKLNLSYSEINSLYNICGYIVSSIQKVSKTCENCISAVGSKMPLYKTFTRFTLIRRFNETTFFFCNEKTFCFFLDMESVFVKYLNHIQNQNIDLKTFYVNKINEIDFDVPNCHKLREKLISRFVIFRLKINSKKKQHLAKTYASKSVAGHAL